MELPMKAYVKLELHAVIQYLALKGETVVRIHRELERVYGVGCIDVSNVRWWWSNFVSSWQSGLEDELRSLSLE